MGFQRPLYKGIPEQAYVEWHRYEPIPPGPADASVPFLRNTTTKRLTEKESMLMMYWVSRLHNHGSSFHGFKDKEKKLIVDILKWHADTRIEHEWSVLEKGIQKIIEYHAAHKHAIFHFDRRHEEEQRGTGRYNLKAVDYMILCVLPGNDFGRLVKRPPWLLERLRKVRFVCF